MLEYDRKKVGEYLKVAREEVNLTQAQVSKVLGYSSPQFISNIERGISVAPLAKLAKMIQMYRRNPVSLEKILLASQEELLKEKLKKFAKSKHKVRSARWS